jgi:hypothetical protein
LYNKRLCTIYFTIFEKKYNTREMGGSAGRWMAKKGDGWLSREIGGYEGRWVAKQGDG